MVSGYCWGVVRAFSTSEPSTRAHSGLNCMAGSIRAAKNELRRPDQPGPEFGWCRRTARNRGEPRTPDEGWLLASGRPHHGEELGTEAPRVGDDAEKGGENIWISRIGIDLGSRQAHCVSSSETRARRTSSEHRKVGAREARSEAARRNGGKPRERCRAGSRKGSTSRKGSVTGVGRRLRMMMVRGASRWLPWSRRDRLGRGCPTRPRHGASGPSLTWPRGAREASAERLLGVASRPGPVFRSLPIWGNAAGTIPAEALDLREGRPRARRAAHRPPPGG